MTIEFDDLIPSNTNIEFDDLIPRGPGFTDQMANGVRALFGNIVTPFNAAEKIGQLANTVNPPEPPGSVFERVPVERAPFNFARASAVQRILDDNRERQAQYGTIGPIVGPDPSVSSVATGVLSDLVSGGKAARAGINQMAGDITGSEHFLSQARREAAQAELMRAVNTPDFETENAQGIYSGLSSMVRQLPAIAAAVATRNPNIALGGMVAPMVPEEYGKFRQRGADPLPALAGAAGTAATEYITEKLPMGFLVQQFDRAGAGQFLTGMLAREVPREQLATLVQDAIDTAIANPDKTWGDYLAERPRAAYQTLLATITQTGIMGGANAVANRLTRQPEQRAPELPDYQEAAARVFGRTTPPAPPAQPPVQPPAPPDAEVVNRILQAIEQTQNVPNVSPAQRSEAEAPATQAPAPAAGDAAAPAGVPAEPAAPDVEAAGLTFDDLVPDVSQNTPELNTSPEPVQKTPEIEQVAGAITDEGTKPAATPETVTQPQIQQPAQQQQAGPMRLGVDNQPLSEGGKPFKTKDAATKAKKLQPMMRVVKVQGGFALAEKTPAQLAAQAKAAKRLGGVGSGPMSAHAFIAANGGLSREVASDLGIEGNVRVGGRWLYARNGGMTIEQATEKLLEAGYINTDSHNDAYDIIRRSVQSPQYTAQGWEEMAEAEREAQFEDYLAAQQEAGQDDPFGEPYDYTADELNADPFYAPAPDALKAEVQALMAQAEAAGIDVESVLERVAQQTQDQPEQEYYERARQALTEANTRTADQGSNRNAEPAQREGGQEAKPASGEDRGPADRQEGDGQSLTSYTPEEVTQRIERLEQAEAERKAAEAKAEQDERERQQREEIRRRSEAAADTFELGQDPMANLSGQRDIFSAPAEPGIDTAKLEKDFRTYPTKILSVLIERGDLPRLHKAAGVKSANAFGDMPIDDQAAAYVKFVRQGGKPVEGLPADYNAWVASQERDIEVRRLQSDRVVRQANGKPFKTEAGAKQMQERFDLQGTHEIVAVDGGFELRQLSPSAQAEIQRKAEGRESYTDAQAAVAAEMGIGQTADGEWDATDEQFDEMERRTQARMRGESAQPAAPTYTYTQPSKIDTPTQGVLAGAKERKARAFARLKSVREQVKSGKANRLDLLKAEQSHKEAIRAVEDAQEQLERDANSLGLTTVREDGEAYNAEAPRRPYTDDRQLQLFLDNGPDPSQAGPRGEAAQREAVAAVDDLRSTETILGLALSRDYAARQRVSLVGQKVSSAEDLAVLAQVYRDPRFETFRVVFVNDAGKVVSQVGLTSRLPASTQAVMGSDVEGYLSELSATARNRGATGFYMLHNHPSGLATPSMADRSLTQTFALMMPSLEFKSHVVIDTNEYSTIDGKGRTETLKKDFGQPAPYRAQEWADVKISGPADVMSIAKRLQVDEGAITLIHTDSQYNVKAISTIPNDASTMSKEELKKLVLRASLQKQGAQVFAVGRDSKALTRIGTMVVDAIYVEDSGQTQSLRSMGVIAGGAPLPNDRRTRVSPDTSPEFAYLRRQSQPAPMQRVAEDGPQYDPEPTQSPNRDALGRLKFRLGEVALHKLDALTRPLQERFGMRMASPELRKQLRQMKATIEEAKRAAVNVAKEMNAMTEADRAMVSDIVEKMIAPGVVPPEHAVKVADAITRTMDQQTDELVALGMLSADSADRWRGRYLPRIYNRETELADDPLIKRLFKTGTPTMAGIGGGSLKGRGLFQDVSVDAVDQWLAMGYEVRDPHWRLNQGKLELKDPNAPKVARDMVTVWRDWTPSERAQMGESRDAMYRFVMGYTAMQRDIALGRLFNNIANNPEWVRRSGSKGWVQVPNTEIPDTGGVKRYGNLAGLYVRRDVMSHLTQFEEAANDTLQLYREALGLWKEGKTALNLVSHFNNVMANVSMAHFAGVSYWDGHKYVNAVRDLVNDAPMVDEARKVGLFTGSFTKEEMVQAMPPELQKLANMEEGEARRAGKLVMNAMTFWLRKPLRDAYEFEDTFFKYLIYRDARQQGLDPTEAMDYALRYIFTYDDLPSGARKVRDYMIPFFSWTYKAIPALLHTAMVYPWRFLAPAAVLHGINIVAYSLAAGDEDDDWLEKIAKGRELETEEREVLPEFMAGLSALGNPKTIRLGTDKLTGHPVFLDVSRVVPGGDMFDMVNQAGGIAMPAPLMPNHPVLSAFSAMIVNKEMFFGRDIVDKNDTWLEAAEKRAKWMAGLLLPAVSPGGYHSQRILDATANAMDTVITTPLGEFTGVDRSGLPVQPKFAAMQTIGIKARPVDLELEEQRRRAQEAALVNSIAAEVRSMARLYQRGAVSDRMMDKTREQAREKIERMREER
jgi:alkylhydroperoxidase/carboxymuconolactone decarboxylase family protein YurZ